MTGSSIVQGIELLVALLGLAALVAIVARPLRLPYTVALVAVGLVIGSVASALEVGREIEIAPELVLLVLLPGLVFEAAYRLQIDQLRRWSGSLLLLAVPGVLISAGVVAVVLNLATSLPFELAFIVGAMVSATDPAAVVATFKQMKVSPSLSTMVDGESLLNDGTGLVLFAIAVRAVSEPVPLPEAAMSFVASLVISAAIGLVAGYLASRLIAAVDDHLIQLTVTVVLAYGSYLLADALHLSGIIATVVAAVVLGNTGRGRKPLIDGVEAPDEIDTVWEFLAYLLTAAVFLLVGLAIPVGGLLGSLGPIAWAVAGVLAGRAIVIYGLLGLGGHLGARLRWRAGPAAGPAAGMMPGAWLHILFWSGLRGAVAVAAALALPADLPQRDLLQEITFGVVLFTLLVQATTVGRVVARATPENEPD